MSDQLWGKLLNVLISEFNDSVVASDKQTSAVVRSIRDVMLFCTEANVRGEPVVFSLAAKWAKCNDWEPSISTWMVPTTDASRASWLKAVINVGGVLTQMLTRADWCSLLSLINWDNVFSIASAGSLRFSSCISVTLSASSSLRRSCSCSFVWVQDIAFAELVGVQLHFASHFLSSSRLCLARSSSFCLWLDVFDQRESGNLLNFVLCVDGIIEMCKAWSVFGH